jgi:hypothetical protein
MSVEFIVIDPIAGQYTLTFPSNDYIDFLLIKQFCLKQSWEFIKDDSEIYFPVLSQSASEDDDTKIIEEDKPLCFYKLEKGGVLFIHYIKIQPFSIFE